MVANLSIAFGLRVLSFLGKHRKGAFKTKIGDVRKRGNDNNLKSTSGLP